MDVDSLFRDFAARVRSNKTLPVVHKAYGARPLVGEIQVTDLPPEEPAAKPALGKARRQRIEDALLEAAHAAMGRIDRGRRTISRDELRELFAQAIEQTSAKIIEASKIDQAEIAARKKTENQKLRDYLSGKRTNARKALADELREGRKRLRKLQLELLFAENSIKERILKEVNQRRKALADSLRATRARVTLKRKALEDGLSAASETLWQEYWKRTKPIIDEAACKRIYPDAPPPMLSPNKDGLGLPVSPGIYFLWEGDVVRYVGQSIRLGHRVRLGSHHVLKQHYRISYVLVEPRELTWAECYYIGVLRPEENFGDHASHKRQ